MNGMLIVSKVTVIDGIVILYIAIQYSYIINEMAPQVNGFAGFCHYCLLIMSAHTYAYRYPLFESEGLSTIAL